MWLTSKFHASEDIAKVTFEIEGIAPMNHEELHFDASLNNSKFIVKDSDSRNEHIDKKLVELIFYPKEHMGITNFNITVIRENSQLIEPISKVVKVSIEVLSDFVLLPRYLFLQKDSNKNGFVGEIMIKSSDNNFEIEGLNKPSWVSESELIKVQEGYHLVVKTDERIFDLVNVSKVILKTNDQYSPKISIPIVYDKYHER